MDNEVIRKYGDIINREYVKSSNHLPMSIENRAAQFSPFAALTGYEEAIDCKKNSAIQKIADMEKGEIFIEAP